MKQTQKSPPKGDLPSGGKVKNQNDNSKFKNGQTMTITESVRQFLEYSEVERGKSRLTMRNYQFYLERFLKWVDVQNANIQHQISNIQNNSPKSFRRVIEEKSQHEHRDFSVEDSFEMTKQGKIASSITPRNDEEVSEIEKQLVVETGDITQELVRQYRLYLSRFRDKKGQELGKQTQNYHIIALRAYLKFLASRGMASLSPEKVELAKTGDRQITFLEQEEVERLLDGIDPKEKNGLRDRACLELLFSTGLRVSELVGLSVDQLNLDRGEMAVLGKGKKERVVFISQDAVNWLKKYLLARGDAAGPLFGLVASSGNRQTLTVRTVERIVKKYALKAGIVKKVSPHTLRHSFATDLLINGADIRSVQSLLGHSSITTTQVYTHLTDQHLREVHQAFHSRRRKVDSENTE